MGEKGQERENRKLQKKRVKRKLLASTLLKETAILGNLCRSGSEQTANETHIFLSLNNIKHHRSLNLLIKV